MAKANDHGLSIVAQLKNGQSSLGSHSKRVVVSNQNHNCKYGQPETVDHILKDCTFCEPGCSYQRKPSLDLDLIGLRNNENALKRWLSFLAHYCTHSADG